jgi:hypothetical protein
VGFRVRSTLVGRRWPKGCDLQSNGLGTFVSDHNRFLDDPFDPLHNGSLLISRAVDMHQETNQTMLQTLYEANANLAGLIIIFTLATFLFFGLLFIRREWPGQKLP